MADSLQEFGYPIVSWRNEFNGEEGRKDPWLIQQMGAKGLSWVTKDDEAKREHEAEIRAARISVVWVRGVARSKGNPVRNNISIRDVHKLLASKLDDLTREIQNANNPLYFYLYLDSAGKPVVRRTSLEEVFPRKGR